MNGNPISKVDPLGLLEQFTFDRSSGMLTDESCSCSADSATPAFSGRGRYKNRPEFENVPDTGPIPSGRYYIVEPYYYRPGSALSPIFFKLYRDDGSIDDETITEKGTKRGQFRLHPGTVSTGCITLNKETQQARWDRLQHKLITTKTGIIPGTNIIYYGTIGVK